MTKLSKIVASLVVGGAVSLGSVVAAPSAGAAVDPCPDLSQRPVFQGMASPGFFFTQNNRLVFQTLTVCIYTGDHRFALTTSAESSPAKPPTLTFERPRPGAGT